MEEGKEIDEKMIGDDKRKEMEVLKIKDKKRKLVYVEFGEDNKVRVGDWVVEVGNKLGIGGKVN